MKYSNLHTTLAGLAILMTTGFTHAQHSNVTTMVKALSGVSLQTQPQVVQKRTVKKTCNVQSKGYSTYSNKRKASGGSPQVTRKKRPGAG